MTAAQTFISIFPGLKKPGSGIAAAWANEAVRPAQLNQVVCADFLASEGFRKLSQPRLDRRGRDRHDCLTIGPPYSVQPEGSGAPTVPRPYYRFTCASSGYARSPVDRGITR